MSPTGGSVRICLHYREGSQDIMLKELLDTEGLPYHPVDDLGDLSRATALVLGQINPSGEEIRLLREYVEGGGLLLTVRPTPRLASLLGIQHTGLTQKDGHITLSPALGGSESERLQLFGRSILYEGGEALAGLSPRNDHAAIIKTILGRGTVIILAFDLASTFLAIQQPDSEVGRAYDTTVVEPELASIPQLDRMRRIIVNLIIENADPPLPRKWYFPGKHRALLVLGGDQDGSDGRRVGVVADLIRELDAPYTLFLTPTDQPISPRDMRKLGAAGMDMGLHADFTGDRPFGQEEYKSQLRSAEEALGNSLKGSRNHALRWAGALQVPLWMESCGLQFNSDLGLMISDDHPQTPGYFAGGGLPFHFIHPEEFRRIDVLEQPLTAGDDVLFWKSMRIPVRLDRPGWLPDRLDTSSLKEAGRASTCHESSVDTEEPSAGVRLFVAGLGLSEEEAFEAAKKLLDESLGRYFTVQCYCLHPAYLASRATGESLHHSDSFLRALVRYARRRGALIMSHGEWNGYWRLRESVAYLDTSWDPEAGRLEFKVQGEAECRGITHLIPLRTGVASIRVDGIETPSDPITIEGQKALIFASDAGRLSRKIVVTYARREDLT